MVVLFEHLAAFHFNGERQQGARKEGGRWGGGSGDVRGMQDVSRADNQLVECGRGCGQGCKKSVRRYEKVTQSTRWHVRTLDGT